MREKRERKERKYEVTKGERKGDTTINLEEREKDNSDTFSLCFMLMCSFMLLFMLFCDVDVVSMLSSLLLFMLSFMLFFTVVFHHSYLSKLQFYGEIDNS